MPFEIEHKGRTYEWSDGSWFDSQRYMTAPEGIRNELNAAFVKVIKKDPNFIANLESPTREALFHLLKTKMGMSLEALSSIGFFEEVLDFNPEVALANLYSDDKTPSGLSFTNCKRLRDRFFEGLETEPFGLPVKLLGKVPFDLADMKSFLKREGVALWKRGKPMNALVLGREGWTESELDEIVDEAEGAVLQIYSQEMFVSVLAGHPDPFCTWPLRERLWDMYAFRSGHPALEYVSNGWAGWIKGVGATAPLSWTEHHSDFNQVEKSPLAILDYKVGESGYDEFTRQGILRSAFEGALPFVESAAYMETWGQPETAERLKRIAQHLANSIEKHRNRVNHHTAVSDWTDDLKWLRETFYRGVYRFNWPQV